MFEDKDTLLQACGGRWGDYEISKTHLGLHIVFFWSWALPLYGVLWLLSRPFHYLGELAEVVFQTWKMHQDPPRRDYVHDFDELWGSAEGCWGTCCKDDEERFDSEELAAMVSQAYYTDEEGVDHRLHRFSKGERVLFFGELYEIYCLDEPSYILRKPDEGAMSSVSASENDLEMVND